MILLASSDIFLSDNGMIDNQFVTQITYVTYAVNNLRENISENRDIFRVCYKLI